MKLSDLILLRRVVVFPANIGPTITRISPVALRSVHKPRLRLQFEGLQKIGRGVITYSAGRKQRTCKDSALQREMHGKCEAAAAGGGGLTERSGFTLEIVNIYTK